MAPETVSFVMSYVLIVRLVIDSHLCWPVCPQKKDAPVAKLFFQAFLHKFALLWVGYSPTGQQRMQAASAEALLVSNVFGWPNVQLTRAPRTQETSTSVSLRS